MSRSENDESMIRVPDDTPDGRQTERDVGVRYPQLSDLIDGDVSDLDGERNSVVQLRRVLADMQGSLDSENIE